ncbi:MAG: FAD-dependent oxidoreductase [Rhodothermales bacterium]|nr:FAD-dependent oxidoreductase [Rhodothermales bacterium]
MSDRPDLLIIGGGVIGRCTALFAAHRGLDVAVVDRGVHEESASTGNAGMIVPSHIVPLAAPGVIAQGMKWLTRPDSPFFIKPRADRRLARWLWLFKRHCTADHVQRSVPILRDLSLESRALFDRICGAGHYADAGYCTDGLIMVHRSQKCARDNEYLAETAAAAGLDAESLDAAGVEALAGAVPTGVRGGVLFRQDAHIDPERFLGGLRGECEELGVRFIDGANVEKLSIHDGRVDGVIADGERLAADAVTVAAGAWTPEILRTAGVDIPLQPAKGYSVTLGDCDRTPGVPMIVTDDKVTITPLPDGVRFGGTLELAGFDASRSEHRIRAILAAADDYRPETSGTTSMDEVWSGFRPASPDGLPFIGPAPGVENLYVATGHGMMGVTLGPITGRLLADLITGEAPSLDMSPFEPGRFS